MTEKYYKGALPPHNPRKNKKHKRPLREKKPPSVKAFGCPIKNFWNDERCGCLIKALRHDRRRGSFLNDSTRNLNNGRRHLYGSQ